MERAVVLCGSAKPDGVTAAMCRSAVRVLEIEGYSVRSIRLSDIPIAHCTDCGGCRSGRCIVRDGMDTVMEAFSDSDLAILASPIHFSGPSSLMKTAMDRFQPYWYDRTMPHPERSAGLLCGGSDSPRFENTVSIFRAFSITVGMEWAGYAGIGSTDRDGTMHVDGRVEGFLEGIIGRSGP